MISLPLDPLIICKRGRSIFVQIAKHELWLSMGIFLSFSFSGNLEDIL